MNRELRLRYLVQLASNIGVTAQREAREFERSQDAMTRATRQTDRSARDLERTLGQLGNNTSMERQVRYFDRLASSVERAKAHAHQLRETLAQGAKNLPEVAATGAAAYYGGRTLAAPPLRAFADLEEATVGLKTSMLQANGKVDKAFGDIAKKAEQLGNQLPGTTKDFFQSANELIRQGVPPSVVAGGALEASAKFGVLMKMDQGQAARTIAKVREAYGLQETELPQMADLMQRGAYAGGLEAQDYLDVAAYAAPIYNTMKLKGLENAKQLIAVQGIAGSVGLEKTAFGTNFAQMLQRLNQIDSRSNRNSAEAKEVRAVMKENGIKLRFYDDKGEFAGIENMMQELAKMRGLSTANKQHIAKVLFGDEAGRPAQILMDKGLEAYREQLSKMDNQASLDQRLDSVLTSLKSKLEALGGTIEGVMARLGQSTGLGSKPFIDGLNSVVAPLGSVFEANPVASGAGLAGLGFAGAAGAVRGYGALRGLFSGAGAAAGSAPAVTAAAVSNPFRGLGVSIAPAAAAPSMAARLGAAGRWLGPLATLGLAGVESYDAITDDNLTAMGKTKGVTMAAGGAAGTLLGAKVGAAAGSLILPGLGTVAGGLIGGAVGYLGGRYGVGAMWGDDPQRDFVRVSAPNGAAMGGVTPGAQTTVQLGEGVLRLDVRVSADGSVSTSSQTLQPMQLLRIEHGSTDPGSFAATGGSFR